MSDIDEPGHQQNTETPDIVNKEEFTRELQNYYKGYHENSKKLQWTNQRIQSVIKLLDEYNTIKSQGRRPSDKHYYHVKKHEVIDIGNQRVLIMKRKSVTDPIVQIIPSEEYYQKILEAHIATSHGRRDKIYNAFKDKYVVPIFAVTMFLSMCKTCLTKKSSTKRGSVVKPFLSNDFRRGQMDLVDFQTCPDQEYKWLLQYQDLLTKFCFLRPLKSIQAKEVAIEVLKIFLEVGCPQILQSGNGREFTASVLKEIVSLWPACKIVNGYLDPESQERIERSNEDIQNMIRAWMEDNNSTNWSIGCYFVQFHKNSSHDSAIARTPYKALFGQDPKLGLSSTSLSKNMINKLENEEDLQQMFEDSNDNIEQDSDKDQEEEEQKDLNTINFSEIDIQNIKQEETTAESHELMMSEEIKIENDPESPTDLHDNLPVITEVFTKTILDNGNNIKLEKQEEVDENIVDPIGSSVLPYIGEIIEQRISFVCHICNEESSGALSCTKCKKIVHAECGVSEENGFNGSQFLCNLCVSEQYIVDDRTQSHDLKRAADKTISISCKKFKDINTGSLLVEVPKVDTDPLDGNNLVGKVLLNNALYQIKLPIPPLRTVASSSSFGGQGTRQCNCKKVKNGQCVSNKCGCKKNNVLCNSGCHSSLTCNNN